MDLASALFEGRRVRRRPVLSRVRHQARSREDQPVENTVNSVNASVSVIVPAYNIAPYIERCIASLLAQTVPLQIIVVNDGSTDDTFRKVRAIGHRWPHSMILVEQSNRGLSASRNAGLDRAHGEFIGFVDGDDWVEPDMYSTLVRAAREGGGDVVICNGEMVDHHTLATTPFHDEERFAELATRQMKPFDARTVPDAFRLDTSACKRLYRRSLLQQLDFRFAEGFLFEDILAHYQFLMSSAKIQLLNRKFYKYRINRPGRLTDRRDERLLTVFEIMKLSTRTLTQNNASDEIWACFIWFQSWVLRWLTSQVDLSHQDEFVRGVVSLGRQFPRTGIIEFQHKFHDDQVAQLAVAMQIFGWKRAFAKFAANRLSDSDRRTVARAGRLRKLAPCLGRWS